MSNKITSENTQWHEPKVKRHRRENLNAHKGKILWFTGFSGSGKSTITHALEEKLHDDEFRTYALNGGDTKKALPKDLGFSDADRIENIRRIEEISKLMIDVGTMVMTAFISPFKKASRMKF